MSDDEFTPLLAKLSRILAVYSKIEVSDDEFTPLGKAEPYIGRIQQIEVSDDEFTPLSEAEPYIGRIPQNRGVR